MRLEDDTNFKPRRTYRFDLSAVPTDQELRLVEVIISTGDSELCTHSQGIADVRYVTTEALEGVTLSTRKPESGFRDKHFITQSFGVSAYATPEGVQVGVVLPCVLSWAKRMQESHARKKVEHASFALGPSRARIWMARNETRRNAFTLACDVSVTTLRLVAHPVEVGSQSRISDDDRTQEQRRLDHKNLRKCDFKLAVDADISVVVRCRFTPVVGAPQLIMVPTRELESGV